MEDSKVSRRKVLALTGAAAFQAACSKVGIPERACCLAREPELFPAGTSKPKGPVPGFNAMRRRVWGYDEIHGIDADIHRPETEAELAALVRKAYELDHKITVRAGGQSLGEHALGSTIVLMSSDCFRKVGDVYAEGSELLLKCGAGARWGEVVRKISDRGYVPRSVVTSGDATVGGTAVVDGLSRMSPIVGKEGEQIKSFRMIDGQGRIAEYTRSDQEFNALIASFGTLGVVTEVTFRVARALPGCNVRPDVKTKCTRYMPGTYNWETLLKSIARDSKEYGDIYNNERSYKTNRVDPRDAGDPQPIHDEGPIIGFTAAGWLVGEGLAIDRFEHSYVHGLPGKRIGAGLYTEDSRSAILGELVAGYSPTLTQFASTVGFPTSTYVDELCGFMFNLGNSATPAKAIVRNRGGSLNFVQQTFIIPTTRRSNGEYDVQLTRQFVYLVLARCRQYEVRPFTVDFLHLPADGGYLSASRDLEGFGVTLTFGDHNARAWQWIQETLMALSTDAFALGGRVHLVKNVEADCADLWAMYRDGFEKFKKVKDCLDPRGIFTNAFYDCFFSRWDPR